MIADKTKFADAEPGDGVGSCFVEECATPSAVVKPLQTDDAGRVLISSPTEQTREAKTTLCVVYNALLLVKISVISVCIHFYGDTALNLDALDTTLTTVKKKAGQERKVRKPSTSLKKTILRPSGRSSRIENSSARLLVSQGGPPGTIAAEKNGKSKHLPPTDGVFVAPTDTMEPLSTAPPPPGGLKSVLKDSSSTSISPSPAPSSIIAAAFAVPDFPPLSNTDQTLENGHTAAFKGQPGPAAVTQTSGSTVVGPGTEELNHFPAATIDLPQTATSVNEGDTQPTLSCSPSHQSASSVSTSSLSTAAPDSRSASTSVGLITTSASSVLASSAPPFCSTAASDPLDLPPDPLGTSKPGADASVVSLKIIISDDKDGESSSDPALGQAVSSISGERIPTIYLSSPAKSPGLPGTPRISSDEVAQAVSGLQTSEEQASPLAGRSGAVAASLLTGAPQLQQNYIIQFPLDAAAPAVQGAPASYILVTEPPKPDAQPRPVLLSAGVAKAPLPFSQSGVPAQAGSPSYAAGNGSDARPLCVEIHSPRVKLASRLFFCVVATDGMVRFLNAASAGSTLILPSPAKPVMLPVSVMGQNTMAPVHMVPSQVI